MFEPLSDVAVIKHSSDNPSFQESLLILQQSVYQYVPPETPLCQAYGSTIQSCCSNDALLTQYKNAWFWKSTYLRLWKKR